MRPMPSFLFVLRNRLKQRSIVALRLRVLGRLAIVARFALTRRRLHSSQKNMKKNGERQQIHHTFLLRVQRPPQLRLQFGQCRLRRARGAAVADRETPELVQHTFQHRERKSLATTTLIVRCLHLLLKKAPVDLARMRQDWSSPWARLGFLQELNLPVAPPVNCVSVQHGSRRPFASPDPGRRFRQLWTEGVLLFLAQLLEFGLSPSKLLRMEGMKPAVRGGSSR
mmetsp:Transcript_48062/g.104571  ORF Transcript_48062/g.104571 Transcript_48062/m.104571 type:complete len:225 (-) Transcript_48062:68-742(-)